MRALGSNLPLARGDVRTEVMNLIQQLEAEQAAKLVAARAIPEFQPGDTVRVNVRVVEGNRTRVQAYEGVCTDLPPSRKR